MPTFYPQRTLGPGTLYWSPAEMGINNVAINGGAAQASAVIDVSGYRVLTVIWQFANVLLFPSLKCQVRLVREDFVTAITGYQDMGTTQLAGTHWDNMVHGVTAASVFTATDGFPNAMLAAQFNLLETIGAGNNAGAVYMRVLVSYGPPVVK